MCVIEIAPTIETRRLVLRAPQDRDAPRLAELCNDFDIARMTARMPHPYRIDDANAFVGAVAAQDPTRDNAFLIEHPDEGPVGVIGLFQDSDPFPEIGYWIGKPYWGRGFATEALDAALGWAKQGWKKRAIAAGHFPDNPASGRVLSKAGFLYTGEVRVKPSVARKAETPVRMMVWLA
jgi:RimJ/RimL family protein N-acetyltransferase